MFFSLLSSVFDQLLRSRWARRWMSWRPVVCWSWRKTIKRCWRRWRNSEEQPVRTPWQNWLKSARKTRDWPKRWVIKRALLLIRVPTSICMFDQLFQWYITHPLGFRPFHTAVGRNKTGKTECVEMGGREAESKAVNPGRLLDSFLERPWI